jgi:hypothetical protein
VRHGDSFGEEEDLFPVGSHARRSAYRVISLSANEALDVKSK